MQSLVAIAEDWLAVKFVNPILLSFNDRILFCCFQLCNLRTPEGSIDFFFRHTQCIRRAFCKTPLLQTNIGATENGAPRCVYRDMLFYSYLNRKNCGRPVIVYLFLQHRPYAVQYSLNVYWSQQTTSGNDRVSLIVAFFRKAVHRTCIWGWLGKSSLKNIVSAL